MHLSPSPLLILLAVAATVTTALPAYSAPVDFVTEHLQTRIWQSKLADDPFSPDGLAQTTGISFARLSAISGAKLDLTDLLATQGQPLNTNSSSPVRQWQPNELQAPRIRGTSFDVLLGQYVNGSEHIDAKPRQISANANARAPARLPRPILRNDDPVFYSDASLLSAEVPERVKGLIGQVFRPIVDSDSGKVRLSVFGFGNFSIERSTADQRLVLKVHNEPLIDPYAHPGQLNDPSAAQALPTRGEQFSESERSVVNWYGFARQYGLQLLAFTVIAYLITRIMSRVVDRRIAQSGAATAPSEKQHHSTRRNDERSKRATPRRRRSRRSGVSPSASTPQQSPSN